MAEKKAEGQSPSAPEEDDGKLEDLSPFRVAVVGASLSKHNAHNFLSGMLLMKKSLILIRCISRSRDGRLLHNTWSCHAWCGRISACERILLRRNDADNVSSFSNDIERVIIRSY